MSLIWIGVYARLHWNDWSQGANLHPDEYGLANTLSQLTLPGSFGEYFNTRLSPLSPYQKYDIHGRVDAPGPDNRMRWGQWPIIVIRWVAEKTGFTAYAELVRLGRRLSALADCLTLLLLFLIGRRLYGRLTALLATALSSLAVLQIQQSHFMTVDTMAVFFTTAAMYCAVRATGVGRGIHPVITPDARGLRQKGAGAWKWYGLFGVAAGMAVASRINLLPILGEIVVAAAIVCSLDRPKSHAMRIRAASGAILRIALAFLVAAATFRVTHPMAIRAETGETTVLTLHPNSDWVESMKVAAAESNLEAGGPPAEQWTNRPRLLFPLVNMVVWGMGLPLGLAGCAGIAWAFWRAIRCPDWRTHLLPLSWAGGYFLIMGTRYVMSLRYFLPIYPFVTLLAAWGLAELWRESKAQIHPGDVSPGPRQLPFRLWSVAAGILLMIVVFGTLAWAWSFTSVYRFPSPRIQASRWIYGNVPRGAAVAGESWDESLPLPLDGHNPFGGLYRGLTIEVRWPDTEDKRRMLLDNLGKADYIILSSQRALWSISRLPNTYPMTMEYYRALFDGRLGFDLAAQFSRPLQIGPLYFSDLIGRVAWRRAPSVPASRTEPFNAGQLAAEEAFSVYDHAPVWIFRKDLDFSLEKARAILGGVDLSRVAVQSPLDTSLAPTRLMLPPDRLSEQRAGGTWREIFNPEAALNKHPALGVLAWYLAIQLLGWLAFPLVFAALRNLPDRGYPLARTIGLLTLAWTVWILGSYRLLPFARSTIIFGILILAAFSVLTACFHRTELLDYLRHNFLHIVLVEALFLGLFIFDLFIRLGNPDLWHPSFGGEKPMVFSYFNAVLKSTSFPPYDPWLAGGYINYYYFGFVMAAQIVKLLGIVPSFAYNLIVPTIFALLGINVFCVAYNLVEAQTRAGRPDKADGYGAESDTQSESPAAGRLRDCGPEPDGNPTQFGPYLSGIASLLFVAILGNLAQVRVLAEKAGALAGPGSLYWDASRIIAASTKGNEINEFPFFTFLYGDMHAHMMDMPIVVLAFGWAAAYVTCGLRKRSVWESCLLWFFGGLVLGATRVTNTWDFPTCFALAGAAVLAVQWRQNRRITRTNLAAAGGRLLLLAGLAIFLYCPFDQWFVSPLSSVDLWKGVKTPLEPYLICHGLFLFVLLTFLLRETRRWLAETPASVLVKERGWLLPAAIAICVLVISGSTVAAWHVAPAAVAIPAIVWSGLLLLRSHSRLALEKRSVIILFAMGMGITLFVELYAVGGDRVNTLFKFYLQVWLLLGTAAGPALAWVCADKATWTPIWRRLWTGALSLVVAAAALYPVTATYAKIHDRFPSINVSEGTDSAANCKPVPGVPVPDMPNRGLPLQEQHSGLDGAAYMQWSAYCDNGYLLPLSYDYDAMKWLQLHVQGSPVIAEAQSFNLYRMSGRYCWNTGLPDVVGWDWHQRQQRAAISTQFITERGNEVTRFFSEQDMDHAAAFLRKYDVRYVVVGPLERAYYLASGGLDKFNTMTTVGLLAVVYRNPGVTIYQVKSPVQ